MSLIFITGMTGAGKTATSRSLAAKLLWSFCDLDQEIERREAKAVAEIFAEKGAAAFRTLETTVLRDIVKHTRTVVALGAGALESEENARLVQRAGLLVYLCAPLELLARRLQNDTARPLLCGARDPAELKQILRAMLARREQRYRQADITIEVRDGQSPDELAETILRRLPETCLSSNWS